VKDVEVGLVVQAVLRLKPLGIGVEAVAIEHGELARPDQPGAGAWIVAHGLDVVDELRQLAVRLDLAVGQVRNHLLVRHGQDHVAAGLVVEAGELRADPIPALGLLPELCRVDDRHGHLLAPDGVDLLAQDGFDPIEGTTGERERGEDAGRQGLDVACPHKQLVAGRQGVGVGRREALGLGEKAAHAHGVCSS
jgi:hypothetical protein